MVWKRTQNLLPSNNGVLPVDLTPAGYVVRPGICPAFFVVYYIRVQEFQRKRYFMKKRTIQLIRSILLIGFCLNANFTFAEIYKWTDEKGNVHYGDKPTSKGKQIDVTKAAAKTGNMPEKTVTN